MKAHRATPGSILQVYHLNSDPNTLRIDVVLPSSGSGAAVARRYSTEVAPPQQQHQQHHHLSNLDLLVSAATAYDEPYNNTTNNPDIKYTNATAIEMMPSMRSSFQTPAAGAAVTAAAAAAPYLVAPSASAPPAPSVDSGGAANNLETVDSTIDYLARHQGRSPADALNLAALQMQQRSLEHKPEGKEEASHSLSPPHTAANTNAMFSYFEKKGKTTPTQTGRRNPYGATLNVPMYNKQPTSKINTTTITKKASTNPVLITTTPPATKKIATVSGSGITVASAAKVVHALETPPGESNESGGKRRREKKRKERDDIAQPAAAQQQQQQQYETVTAPVLIKPEPAKVTPVTATQLYITLLEENLEAMNVPSTTTAPANSAVAMQLQLRQEATLRAHARLDHLSKRANLIRILGNLSHIEFPVQY
jgi:hypothetical protein